MPTVDMVVKGYVQLRDKKKEMAEQHKEEMRPINEAMEKMEGWLQRALLKSGVESMKTSAGTAFLKTATSATVKDRDDFLKFVIEKQMYDLLENRCAKSVVMDYLESTGEVVPGVDIQRVQVVQVRR